MLLNKSYFYLLGLSLCMLVSACNKKQQAYSSQPNGLNAPSSMNPGANPNNQRSYGQAPKQKRSFWIFGRKKPQNIYDQKVQEYYDRMEANAKKYKKMEKEMKKPQYSDPSYFGHKRKPKKRPPGKKKFCKECGIWH